MIPVRIDPAVKPLLANDRVYELEAAHPLLGVECPACGDDLQAGQSLVLVLAGRRPDMGWTAGAVAVHEACAR